MHTETIYPDGHLCQPIQRSAAVRPHGLVLYSTSRTHEVRTFKAHASRLKRMKRAVVTSARIHTESSSIKGFRRPKAAMLTLTYRDDEQWGRNDVADLLQRIRVWLKRRGVPKMRYTWVLELTKRGRPHYHIVFWLPKGLTLPKPDKQGWWTKGSTRIEWARSPVGYLAKYASKGGDNTWQLPSGARLHGSGGFSDEQREERAWILAPGWIRAVWDSPMYRVRPAVGGGWISLETGQWCASPFIATFDGKTQSMIVRPMDVQVFVGMFNGHVTDIGLRDAVYEVLANGGKVVRLGEKRTSPSMPAPVIGDPDTPEYWKSLGLIYSKALDAFGKSDQAFYDEQRAKEWDASFAASTVRIIYIMSNHGNAVERQYVVILCCPHPTLCSYLQPELSEHHHKPRPKRGLFFCDCHVETIEPPRKFQMQRDGTGQADV